MSVESSLSNLISNIEEFGEQKWKEGYLYAAETVPGSIGNLDRIVRQNMQLKAKVAHADRLLRYAKGTECGRLGQFDSWFENGSIPVQEHTCQDCGTKGCDYNYMRKCVDFAFWTPKNGG